jgi:hypothetical protein
VVGGLGSNGAADSLKLISLEIRPSSQNMPRRPRDLNRLAKMVVDIASGEVEDTFSANMRSGVKVRGTLAG